MSQTTTCSGTDAIDSDAAVATRSDVLSLEAAAALTVHPVADLFPMMDDAALKEMADDIKANGLLHPIIKQGETLLDGRNRLAACKLAGVEPRFEEFTGVDVRSFIITSNLHRRHLTESQRAMVAAGLANMKQGERTDIEPCRNSDKVGAPKVSTAQAAELMQVSRQTVQDAKVIKRASPGLAARVSKGELTVHAAKRTLNGTAANKAKAAETHGAIVPDKTPSPADPAEGGTDFRTLFHAYWAVIDQLILLREKMPWDKLTPHELDICRQAMARVVGEVNVTNDCLNAVKAHRAA